MTAAVAVLPPVPMTAPATARATERDATLLGYLGLLPFAACVLVVWTSPLVFSPGFAGGWLHWTMLYAAIILSFMGGARWALAMLADGRRSAPMSGLLAAVAPALLAWLMVIPSNFGPVVFPYSFRLTVLGLGFVALWFEDRHGVRAREAPAWYGRLRTRLTFWVCLSLAFVVLRLLTY